jgi:hypothetical protein
MERRDTYDLAFELRLLQAGEITAEELVEPNWEEMYAFDDESCWPIG